jgi:hypothetical protein
MQVFSDNPNLRLRTRLLISARASRYLLKGNQMYETTSSSNFDRADIHEAVSVASHLWSVLEHMHAEANALTRVHPQEFLSAQQIELTNGSLRQVVRLLEVHGHATHLKLIDQSEPPTYTEALLLIGMYKGAVRAFRLNILKELPYSF